MGRNENQRKKGGKDEIQRVEISDTDSDEKKPKPKKSDNKNTENPDF